MKLLGIDLGSSSIKLAVIDSDTGNLTAKAAYPEKEMSIFSSQSGWAEQSPDDWWRYLKEGLKIISGQTDTNSVEAIGISYQMHGLVCIDKDRKAIRPAVIWCDSRAVDTGNKAFNDIGRKKCLKSLLNSPGNFTASKLAWIKEHEPDNYKKIFKIMLPGDYIAMRLTGEIFTTVTGLSEGIFWDFDKNEIAGFLLDHFGFSKDILPQTTDVFGIQGQVNSEASSELGLKKGIPLTYRSGDQPNNAFSLNVMRPGQIAATAGTSGVIYAVTDQKNYDTLSRINIFAHVNHKPDDPHYGILLCINGAGILYSWIKKNFGLNRNSYDSLNKMALEIPAGSDGLTVIPFGNGSERMLENKHTGSYIAGLDFNIHDTRHVIRAAQEGIAFSFLYGIRIMEKHCGLKLTAVKAGNANMFLSPVFRETLASVTGHPIELYDTDQASGSARGAGIGIKAYKNADEAFTTLKKILTVDPGSSAEDLNEYYEKWLTVLSKIYKTE